MLREAAMLPVSNRSARILFAFIALLACCAAQAQTKAPAADLATADNGAPPDVPTLPTLGESEEQPFPQATESGEAPPLPPASKTLPTSGQTSTSPSAAGALPGAITAFAAVPTGTSVNVPALAAKPPYNAVNGSFVYRVALDLPPFHGIEPKLAFAYNSSTKLSGGGQSQGWLGFGWVLDGLDVIERATARRGTPRYTASDIYLWNGEPLVACTGGSTSPSCTTGGTHFSKSESYLRFSFNAGANTWTITDRTGTRRVLAPVGAFMSGSGSDSIDIKHRAQYRWLLQQVIDTHANTVSFSYVCATAPQCVLDQITYTATEVKLFWEARPDVISYATGVGFGKSAQRLKSVRVTHGGLLQKAFALTYGQNPTSGRSRITAITPYGSDAVLDPAGAVTSGSQLPAHSFEYSDAGGSEGFTLQSELLDTGEGGQLPLAELKNGTAADVNGDGRDELLTGNETCFYTINNGNEVPVGPTPMTVWNFATTPYVGTVLFQVACPSTSTYSRIFLHGHFNADRFLDFLYGYVYKSGSNYFVYFTAYMSRADGTYAVSYPPTEAPPPEGEPVISIPSSFSSPPTLFVIDSNGDGIDEVQVAPNTARELGGDFDGDGIADHNSYSSGGGSIPSWPDEQGLHFVADFNGDGVSDVASLSSSPFTMSIYLSNGSGFAAPLVATPPGSYYGAISGDFNGDGQAELIVGDQGASGPPSSGSDGTPSHVVFVRDGALVTTTWSASSMGVYNAVRVGNQTTTVYNFDNAGDFNGDGLTDVVSRKSGRFSTANGPVDNLMTKAFNGYGAEIDVAYQPSSKWVNDLLPSIEQTVTSIAVKDGRGTTATTTYSYAGGKYNYPERRFLGFGTETEFQPCITGETPPACPTVARTVSQDFASIGSVKDETFRNGGGTIVGQTSRTFTANNTTPPFTSLLTQANTFEYEMPGSALSPDFLAIRKAFTYDAYGNVTIEQDYGRNDVTGDERSSYTDFTPNTSAYIVSLPGRVSTYAALTSAGALIARVTQAYDGAGAYTTAPVKGDLTKRQTQTNAAGTLATESFEYDTYGNRTAAVGPVNNRTEWTFDPTFHLYPVTEKNALLQTKSMTPGYPCGQNDTETDLNGLLTNYGYDVFCRETLRTRPATGAYTATDYLNFGTAATQNVKTRHPHPNGGGAEVYEARYFDGLGRVWREQRIAVAPPDSDPDVFAFTDLTGQAFNTLITSNTLVITGINVGVPGSISGDGSPEFRINGGSWVTSGTLSNNDTLQLRLTSSGSVGTTRSATVTVGTASDKWDVTTGGVDPYWSSVVLLTHMDGADGSTSFTDSSSLGNAVTALGDAQIDTAQSKFGGASALFDGNGDYLTVASSPAFDLWAGDATIEFFARFPTISGN
jgi:Insecticide toxin TcdB middle/N-terminal region/FG-GAP-like repeat/Salmonella virulence plasmid 65kDa B protein